MNKCKDTICQIIGRRPIGNGKDVAQNIYAFRFVLFCMAIYSAENILNILNIFVVDKRIFITGYLVACFFSIIHFCFLMVLGLEHNMTKYVSIATITCIINSASISLTYHMVIIITIPLVIAGMYTSKKMSIYTFVLTIISITISTYCGYYFGLCDANMALLTKTSIDNLEKDGRFLINQVNQNPILTIGLYFVIPRCLMAIAFAYVSNSVNLVIRNSQKKAVQMELKASTDEMTGLYNKNKLITLIDEKVYDYKRIAVIYWDANRLKYVNDNYGHLAGDRLIIKVAKSIRNVSSNDDIAIRYGGDEFLLIIKDGTKELSEEIIKKWRQEIEKLGSDCEFPISASVGYAISETECLKDVIAKADKNMYLCKQLSDDKR